MIRLRDCGAVASDLLLKSESPLPSSESKTPQNNRPFRDKHLAISNYGDHLIIADHSVLKICSLTDQKIIRVDHGDPITQLVIIPLPSVKISKNQTQRFCIAVGHLSGSLRFFSEKGHLILSQVFHKSKILRLKLNFTEKREGLWILYPGTLVAIDGLSLFSELRGSLAHIEAGKYNDVSLDYKKWDVNVSEPKDFIPFHLVSSPVPIINVRQTNSPLYTHQFITAGKDPSIAYFAPSESDATTLIAVASSMATKITSAFSSWFVRQDDPAVDKKHSDLGKGIPIFPKLQLEDQSREVQTLEVDPTGILGIGIDGFGRMLLIDLHELLIVRMWKGYRNVQTSWLLDFPKDEDGRQSLRVVLVVYFPAVGLLEAWQMRHGKRLAVDNVGKGGRLISTYGVLGTPVSELDLSKGYPSQLPRSFLLQSTGGLFEISVV